MADDGTTSGSTTGSATGSSAGARGSGDLRFGLVLGGALKDPAALTRLGADAEAMGFDSLWSSEAWGWDAFSPLTFLAATTSTIGLGTAIAQVSARTPAATAMAVLSAQALSNGRLRLGLGVSGPQVVEGWHGVPFTAPVDTTRELIEVLRLALAGEKVEHHGRHFDIPWRGDGGTGQGRALRTTMAPAPETPLLVAAMGPKNVAMAVVHADGILPYLWSPEKWAEAWGSVAQAKPGFTVAPTVFVAIGDDLTTCRDSLRGRIGFHIGGMGSKKTNFYADLVRRYGYEAEADHIQDLFLGGQRGEAIAAVPDALVDELSLVGPVGHVREQLARWRESPANLLILEPSSLRMLPAVADAIFG